MMKLLEMKMADPANHADPAQSAAMAAEHDEYRSKNYGTDGKMGATYGGSEE